MEKIKSENQRFPDPKTFFLFHLFYFKKLPEKEEKRVEYCPKLFRTIFFYLIELWVKRRAYL